MTKPHIAFVDDYPHANIGGGEQHLLRVARGCIEWGFRVSIVCIPGSGLEAAARAAGYELIPMPAGRQPGVGARVQRLFAAAAPDIVHVHGFYAMTVACPAARRAGVPHVLDTVHNMPSAPRDLRPGIAGRLESRVRAHLYRRTAGSIDRFVCVVAAVRDELLDIGVDASKAVVIANGIPDPATSAERPPKAAGEAILVGSVGRLEPLKGYACLIDAAAILVEQSEHIQFRLVGDGSLRVMLERRAQRLGLGPRFEFAGWSNDALADIAAMDVYVVSSLTDTTNLTILEAMGLGVPVVATDVGGIPDAVADGESGYLVPPHHPDLLADAILQMADDPSMRSAMGAEGRARFERTFTLDRMLESHRELYTGLLGREF
jgi:glycosyltransferase involved in cell wall biosynthesis